MLRIEFRRRLERLVRACNAALKYDRVVGELLPCLFSVYSYMWSRTTKSQIYDNEKPTLDF